MTSSLLTADSRLSPEAWQLINLPDLQLRGQVLQSAHDYAEAQLLALLEAYLLTASAHALHTSPRTLQAYQAAAREYIRWAADQHLPLLDPHRRDGYRYLHHLQSRPARNHAPGIPLTHATVSLYIAGVRALYRALRWADVTHTTFLSDVRPPSDPTPGIVKNPPYLDIEAALPYCDTRLATLLLLCAHSGLRISEALTLNVNDIDGAMLEIKGKAGRQRRVPLSQRCRVRLAELTPDAGGQLFAWTYRQAAHRMAQIFAQAGLPWRGFHAARKAAGTRLYAQTNDFTRVAIFLGHTSTDTTRRYVALRQNDLSDTIDDW